MVHLWAGFERRESSFSQAFRSRRAQFAILFLLPGLCAGVAGVSGEYARNQPETIAPENGRNVHVLLLLRGNSIDAAYCNDRGWVGHQAVCGRLGTVPVPVGAHGGRCASCVHYIY
jgi:hypothetical protein